MRRALFVFLALFSSAWCFAQNSPGFKVIGQIPHASDYRKYQIQVGAFRHLPNAEEAFSRLTRAYFSPAYESFNCLTRVVLNGIAARDVPSYLYRIQSIGFDEVIIRLDSGRPSEQVFCPPEQMPPEPEIEEPEEPVREAAPAPQRPVPLLPAPGNMYPEDGYKIGVEELQRGTIEFSWDAVEGAAVYIFSIHRETPQGRSQIFIAGPLEETFYTLDNWDLFENTGNYSWRVEAIAHDSQGNISRRGNPGENAFTLDVPNPGQVRVMDPGILYGSED